MDAVVAGGECGVPTERRFKMPGPAEDKPWYSFDYGPVHFTIYSTEHHFHHGEPSRNPPGSQGVKDKGSFFLQSR